MKFESSQESQILVSGHPGRVRRRLKNKIYLYPVDLIRFAGFFDIHSFGA